MTTVDTAYPPRLADGIELLGELKDSGFAEPQSLIRRADGQVIQLSRLLYLVSSLMDGARGPDDIASAVSADLGRTLTADQVRYLITAKLAPSRHRRRPGRACRADGQPAARPRGHGSRCSPRRPRARRGRSSGRCSAGR